jgi:type II secretory pathway component GspD/PulD (secretin)
MKVGVMLLFSMLLTAQLALAQKATAKCSQNGLVTLHLRDLDIKAVLRSVAKQGNLNMVVSPKLNASVSVDLDCQPPRRVLRLLVRGVNARYRIVGGVTYVYPRNSEYVLIAE